MLRSPLTGSTNIRLLQTLSPEQLRIRWLDDFGIDISPEVKGVDSIFLYECEETHLRFFAPTTLTGSVAFYAALQEFDWYYMSHKWEHDVALNDIPRGTRVLEVGCGFGDFVERVQREKDADVIGIELNRSAVRKAQHLGRPVTADSVEQLAEIQPESYDVVCHFEVLEHVSNPLEFLQACTQCLKVGGQLLIAVPNMDSFVRYAHGNLLNQPPHHMTQWFPETFRALPKILPLRLYRILYEPLAFYHIDWYVGVQARRFFRNRYARRLWLELWSRPIRFVLKKGLHRVVRGHTQYVAFNKTA